MTARHPPPGADLVGDVGYETWLGAPALSYPARVPTIVDALDRAVSFYGGRPFLVGPEGDTTYAEFAELVAGAVERLREMGLGPGDAVAAASRNGVGIAVALWACARLGLLMVGLNVRLAPTQWAYMLSHSGAAAALAQPEFAAGLAAAAEEAGMPAHRAADLDETVLARRRPWAFTDDDRPDEAAAYAVVYTSGTTGRPKGSLVVHRASMHSAISYREAVGLGGTDRTAVLFPLSYISAMHANVLPMMLVGGSCVLVPQAGPAEFVALMAEWQVTWVYTVPTMWLLMLRLPELCAAELPQLTAGAFGGSPFPHNEVPRLRGRLPGMRLHEVYGLSETHSPAAILLDHEFDTKPGSVGRPLPCMEARVVDDAGRDVDTGGAGELWLRGSLVTTGYHRDPEATAAAITGGWFHTGDVGRMDDDGYVWILDRKKDMIARGGYKVFSAEVERLLSTHPDIDDAAVVGVAEAAATEGVAAYVVARPGADLDAATVRRWVRDGMAGYAMPHWVHFVAELPRNPTGKLEKAVLRVDAAERAAARRPASPE